MSRKLCQPWRTVHPTSVPRDCSSVLRKLRFVGSAQQKTCARLCHMSAASVSALCRAVDAFTTCADCVPFVCNLAVMSLPDWCLCLSYHGWIIVMLSSPAFQPQHWCHCRGCSMPPLVWFWTCDPATTYHRPCGYCTGCRSKKRIDYKFCLLVHKSLTGQASTYIADMLTPVSSVQLLSTQHLATNGDYIMFMVVVKYCTTIVLLVLCC